MKIMKKCRDSHDLTLSTGIKKTAFSLIIILHSVLFFSQSLVILNKGYNVTNKEVSIEGNASDDEMTVFFKINNSSNEQVQVKVRKIENSVVPGSQNSFCLGVCYAPAVSESIFPYTIPAGESTRDSIFSVTYCPIGNAGKSVIKYEVFDILNPENNKVSVTVNFTGSPSSGIDEQITAKGTLLIYPNPCHLDQVTIQFSDTSIMRFDKIILSDISGIVLDSFFNTDHSGNFLIDVHNYPNGLYFLSLIGEKGPLKTEKIIIVR
jgi:hypothetical protein